MLLTYFYIYDSGNTSGFFFLMQYAIHAVVLNMTVLTACK